MSGTFLFAAIVAIWALVLIPRWLRRPHAALQADDVRESDDVQETQDYQDYEVYEHGPEDAGDERGSGRAEPGRPVHAARAVPPPRSAPLSRSRVLQARRRLLTMLVVLTVAAGACTALKLTSWWAFVPPAGMLGMYLLVLREAALADAEQAHRRAVMEMRAQAGQRAYEAMREPDEPPSAQIIDISARVGDQLYDQYADATVRAVGD